MVHTHRFSSQHSVPSPDGALIATLRQSSLNISEYNGATLRSIPLTPDIASKCHFMRWSRIDDRVKRASYGGEQEIQAWPCSRILLANDDNVQIYDMNESKWSGRIERAASNCGRVADVVFGHTPNELLVFSDFGVKLTIWSLISNRGVEIRDPKYLVRCYTYRPGTGHMAILTRPQAQDILMLLNPRDHNLVKSVELPTLDAQEILWSPDGRWLVIRDAASHGHKVLIYTADGHLFKTCSIEQDLHYIGLGVKHLVWNSMQNTLTIGDYNDTVMILSKDTYSPIAKFHHSTAISVPDVTIWQEQVDASKARSYTVASQPASPPGSASFTKVNQPTQGVSVMTFNSDGSLLATKSDSTPTTVWIWSLRTGLTVAVLIHHSPLKNVSWHPTESELLLIHCAIPEPTFHLWSLTWEVPRIVTLPLERASGRLEVSWLLSPMNSHFNLILSSAHQYTTCLLSSSGEVVPRVLSFLEAGRSTGINAEDMFDEGNSLDLSPIKIAHDETLEVHNYFGGGYDDSDSGFALGNEMVEDTFHYRRHVKATN